MTRHTYDHKDLDINWKEYKRQLEETHLKTGFVSTNIYRKDTMLWEEGDRYLPNVMTVDGRDRICVLAYTLSALSGNGSFCNLACSENAGGSSTAHTALAGEIIVNGLQRALANNSHAHTDDTNSSLLDHTWTSSGTFTAVQLVGTFDVATAPVSGVMGHEATITSTPLSSGDKLQVQYTLNLA